MRTHYPLLLLSLIVAAQARADMPSTHGMFVTGTRTVYLSHLPMFHPPHDYQAIFRASLPAAAMAKYVKDRAETGEKVYTIVPEEFALPELAAARKTFKADLVHGHFERGGTTLASGITVKIEEVIHFRKFQRGASHPAELQYLVFGEPGERFAAHLIEARPDFDQVLAVRAAAAGALTIPGRDQEHPLRAGESAAGIAVKDELYFETGDLSH